MPPVGTERHSLHAFGVAGARLQELAGTGVADLDQVVPAGGGQPAAVGAVSQAVYHEFVETPGEDFLPGRAVADPNPTDHIGQSESGAVGAVREPVHARCDMPGGDERARLGVPDAQVSRRGLVGPVHVAQHHGGDLPAVGAKDG